MACAPLEQAVTTAWLGPLKPKRIETWPEARLIRFDGMKNGESRRGPRSCSVSAPSAMPGRPPMPEPIITPVRSRSVLVLGLPAGILDRLLRRGQRKDDELVHLALLLGRDPVVGIEGAGRGLAARHLAGDLRRQVGDVERLDRADARLALDEPLPDALGADAEWRDEAESGDDDPPHVSCDGFTCAPR